MDRKEFIALAVSPLLVPLAKRATGHTYVGEFKYEKVKRLKSTPIYGDIVIKSFDPEFEWYWITTLAVTKSGKVFLRKSFKQRQYLFSKTKSEKMLKQWLEDTHPEIAINFV